MVLVNSSETNSSTKAYVICLADQAEQDVVNSVLPDHQQLRVILNHALYVLNVRHKTIF